jgi:hypothetical protein
MSEKIPLKELILAVDQNMRELFSAADELQQKAMMKEYFILNRYISNVEGGSREIKEHFVLTVNEYFNKHWNTLQKHPELLWQLLCLCNYDGKRVFFHQWIGFKKKDGNADKKIKFLAELYPNKKMDEIKLLSTIMSDAELALVASDMGFTQPEIKKLFK